MTDPPSIRQFRDLLYADQGLVWMSSMTMGGGPQSQQGPWSLFSKAAQHVRAHDRNLAVAELRNVLAIPNSETRVRLWAWQYLRELGEQPGPDVGNQVQGIVLEVPLAGGTDVLAVYADRSARYINHSAKILVWDAPASRVSERIDQTLAEAQKVVNDVPPIEQPPSPTGKVSITLLTFAGLRGAQEDVAALRPGQSPLAPLFTAATATLTALVQAACQRGASGE